MSKEWSYSGPPTRRAPPPSVADGPGLDRYGADGEDTRMADDDDYIRTRLVNRLGNDLHYYSDHQGVHDNDTPVSAPYRATQVEDGGGSISSSSRSEVVPEDDPWRRRTAPESSKNRMMPTSSSHDPSQQPDDYRVTDPVVLRDSHWTMLEGGFSCSLCDTTVVHEAQLRDHIKGKRHQKHLNYLQWERSSHSDSDGTAAAGATAANATIPTTPSGRLSTRADSAGVAIHHSCPTMDEKHAGAATAIRPSEHNNNSSSSSHGRTPPDPASGWMDDSEMEDYTKQCNRQFWTPAGEPRTDGLVDFEGIEGECYAPAHCVYDAMYCCLCQATPDGWWKWIEHFKGKKHLKHVYSTRSTHIAYWQKLSAGTGLVYYYNHLDGYWCWEDGHLPAIDFHTAWEVLRPP
ncbi:hypothetical protein FOZ63_016296 [Perkinsus olseni]|uniref:C2H2-type domain-containing protein n=1 Tax=Perkinsus olseni TaxID=32597 RepID=A0A7J6PZH1_PEROL|nr:hypothetical protein FOZ63_016296 [Perkinsus olseni]